MKKIAIVTEGMYQGGVETTLINLLKKIDSEEYSVTLLLMNNEGKLLQNIPSYVRVKEIPNASSLINANKIQQFKKYFCMHKYNRAYTYIRNALLYKITRNRSKYFKWFTQELGYYKNRYDIAISFTMTDSICIQYVIDCIEAKRKIMWNHIDVSLYKNNELNGLEETFKKFHRIYSVSEYSGNTFLEKYPHLKEISKIAYNFIDWDEIISKSEIEEELNLHEDCTMLLTVGRITSQKGQDIIISIAEKLRKDNFKFAWYLIGPESDKEFFNKLKNEIQRKGLEKTVVILGAKENPYFYMKKCDIYVQPSRYEGFCTTTNEAKVLCKPIITTNVSGANEQFENYETGIIVNVNEDSIYAAIKELFENKDLRKKLSFNLKKINSMQEQTSIRELFEF